MKLTRGDFRPSYDVVIIGGGGHGMATAYYLAKRFGITNVAVLERSYIGSGGTGRNTTVLRANYKTPETIRFYQESFQLYATLQEELDYHMLRSERGLFWLAHSEPQLRNQRERALQNQHFGVNTVYLDARQVHEVCPQIDMTGGGKRPVLGAAYHPPGSIIRHDAVVWGYAGAAQRLGVQVLEGIEVTGLTIQGGKCVGVVTDRGPIAAGAVLSAVGGYVTNIADMAGIRLPIVSHPLQAFVTESYLPVLDHIVASADLHIYVSQSARGEVLIGAEIDPYSSYSTRSTFPFLASAAARAIDLFPFVAKLRVLRQWTGICDMTPDYSPLIGRSEVDRLFISSGWGTWGFKAIPVSGLRMAELIATGTVPPVLAPFALDRFRRDRAVPERASAGTH
ncbi:MAG: FAD-dependent oxidoreductase [Gemmatimonadales bacterium]|nr:FAD-dependent oxidoreductase [Gemmatimonadota bacterium]MCC7132942.1 FAD-dependent oxidoreductase [Gemmatimonadales bacterium]MDX2056784.1 FAD-dependent oxidoreductase [Gemmatimonadales bacterium]